MKLLAVLLVLVMSLVSSVSASSGKGGVAYGVWNDQNNNIAVGKLIFDGSVVYSAINTLDGYYLLNAANSLSTFNKVTNVISFLAGNLKERDSYFLFSYDINTNQFSQIAQFDSTIYQFYSLNSAQTDGNSQGDLLVVASSNWNSNALFYGAITNEGSIHSYGVVSGTFTTAMFDPSLSTFEIMYSYNSSMEYCIKSITADGNNDGFVSLYSNGIEATGNPFLLTNVPGISQDYFVMKVGNSYDVISINYGEIKSTGWMSNLSSVSKIFTMTGLQLRLYFTAYLYQSAEFLDGSFGIIVYDVNQGFVNIIPTDEMISNFWFIESN